MHDLKFCRVFDIDLLPIEQLPTKSITAVTALRNFHANLTKTGQLAQATGFAGLLSSKFTVLCNSGPKAEVESRYVHWLTKVSGEQMKHEIRLHAHLHEKSLKLSQDAHQAFETLLRTMISNLSTSAEMLCKDLYTLACDEQKGRKANVISKPRFSSWQATTDTLKEAFDSEQLNTVLSSPILFTLSLVRNLIVHKYSVVDDAFEKELQKNGLEKNPFPFLESFRKVKSGEILHVDGEIVLSLFENTAHWGYGLISFIDSWIMASSQDRNFCQFGE